MILVFIADSINIGGGADGDTLGRPSRYDGEEEERGGGSDGVCGYSCLGSVPDTDLCRGSCSPAGDRASGVPPES